MDDSGCNIDEAILTAFMKGYNFLNDKFSLYQQHNFTM